MAGYFTSINLPSKQWMMSCQSIRAFFPQESNLNENLTLIGDLPENYGFSKWNWTILGGILFKLIANSSPISTEIFFQGDQVFPLSFSLQVAWESFAFFTINHVFQQNFITSYCFSSLCVKIWIALRFAISWWHVKWPPSKDLHSKVLQFTWLIHFSTRFLTLFICLTFTH